MGLLCGSEVVRSSSSWIVGPGTVYVFQRSSAEPFSRPFVHRRARGQEAPQCRPNARRHQRDVHVHLVLAHGGHRALRPGQHGVLHRGNRRGGYRQGGPLVHPGRHDLQLHCAQRVHRELLDVRPRRRVPRRQGGDGGRAGQALGLCADVRLHSDRPDQRCLGRSILDRPRQRGAGPLSNHVRDPARLGGRCDRGGDHRLLLGRQHPGHPGIERQGAEDHRQRQDAARRL